MRGVAAPTPGQAGQGGAQRVVERVHPGDPQPAVELGMELGQDRAAPRASRPVLQEWRPGRPAPGSVRRGPGSGHRPPPPAIGAGWSRRRGAGSRDRRRRRWRGTTPVATSRCEPIEVGQEGVEEAGALFQPGLHPHPVRSRDQVGDGVECPHPVGAGGRRWGGALVAAQPPDPLLGAGRGWWRRRPAATSPPAASAVGWSRRDPGARRSRGLTGLPGVPTPPSGSARADAGRVAPSGPRRDRPD